MHRRRWFGGLPEPAGEVRRGSPSGYGGIPAKFPTGSRGHSNTPSTPVGYGEFKSLREDRRTLTP